MEGMLGGKTTSNSWTSELCAAEAFPLSLGQFDLVFCPCNQQVLIVGNGNRSYFNHSTWQHISAFLLHFSPCHPLRPILLGYHLFLICLALLIREWAPGSLTVPLSLYVLSTCLLNEWVNVWINVTSLCQKRNSPRRPGGSPSAESTETPGSWYQACCGLYSFIPRDGNRHSQSPTNPLLPLSVALLISFSSSIFFRSSSVHISWWESCLHIWIPVVFMCNGMRRHQWLFAVLLCPLRDLGFLLALSLRPLPPYPHSPGLSPPFPRSAVRATLSHSTCSSYPRPGLAPEVPWADWLQESHWGSGEARILGIQWRHLQGPRMSRWAASETKGTRHRWGPGVVCSAGLHLRILMNPPAGWSQPLRLPTPQQDCWGSVSTVGMTQVLGAPPENVPEIPTIQGVRNGFVPWRTSWDRTLNLHK